MTSMLHTVSLVIAFGLRSAASIRRQRADAAQDVKEVDSLQQGGSLHCLSAAFPVQ
jgi:hypothetical protein